MMASNVSVDLRRSCPSWGLLQQGLHPRQLLGLLGQPSLLLLGQAEGSGGQVGEVDEHGGLVVKMGPQLSAVG